MKIEIWSDYACPFCYIGKRYLERALAEFEQRDQVEIIQRAFELYPQAGKQAENTTQQRIERKYQKSPSEAREMIDHIEQLARKAEIDMRYYTVQNTNTFDAHRLTKFASEQGKGEAMNERLFKAYFTDNLPLADHAVLLQLAEEVGLDRSQTEAMLNSDAYREATEADEKQAQRIGVQGVPYFVVDGKVHLAGSQPPFQFLQVLKQAWVEQTSSNLVGASCGIDGCQE